MTASIDLADFPHVVDPRFRSLLEAWLGARKGRPMPLTGALDPLEHPELLPYLWICTVEEAPRDFRYRLMGEHVRVAYGGYPKNRTLRDITDPSAIDRVLSYFNAVVDEPAVVHVYGRIYAESAMPARGERLILPLAEPATGCVIRIVGATLHSWEERGVGRTPVPDRQVRTFTPVDGRPPWCEAWV